MTHAKIKITARSRNYSVLGPNLTKFEKNRILRRTNWGNYKSHKLLQTCTRPEDLSYHISYSNLLLFDEFLCLWNVICIQFLHDQVSWQLCRLQIQNSSFNYGHLQSTYLPQMSLILMGLFTNFQVYVNSHFVTINSEHLVLGSREGRFFVYLS